MNTQTNEVRHTLTQRATTYGSYKDVAYITQGIYQAIPMDKLDNLSPTQRLSLFMIANKIARIVNGNPNYEDSWVDIAGYAQLVVDELRMEIPL